MIIFTTQNRLDQTDLSPFSGHPDLFQLICPNWNGEDKGRGNRDGSVVWHRVDLRLFEFTLMVESVMRKSRKVKHRVGAGWVLQIAESIDNQTEVKLKTDVEVVCFLADECTITEAEIDGSICSCKSSCVLDQEE